MNGPEHYRGAESLLELATHDGLSFDQAQILNNRAMVRATLADAAARIDACRMSSNLRDEWVQAFTGDAGGQET